MISPESGGPRVRLDLDTVQAIADEVVRQLGANSLKRSTGPHFVNAHEVARRLGRSPAWVRAHAAELGGCRIGSGPRPRLAFDLEVVTSRLGPAVEATPAPQFDSVRPRMRSSSHPQATASGSPLLPIRGPGA